MKLSILLTPLLSLTFPASSVATNENRKKGGKGSIGGNGCVFGQITEFSPFFAPGTDMNRFGRSTVCSGIPETCDESSPDYIGFYQGYCVNSAGPEDAPSELCKVTMLIEGDYLDFEYLYPTYENPSGWLALISGASGCYAGFQGSLVPVNENHTDSARRYVFDLSYL